MSDSLFDDLEELPHEEIEDKAKVSVFRADNINKSE